MSQSSAPVFTLPRLLPLSLLLLLLLLLRVGAANAQTVRISADMGCSALVCAAQDVALLREYVSGLEVVEAADHREPSDEGLLATPFGGLASDWTRLMLLQDRQPEGTPLRDNLLRLSRLVLAAYFDSQDGLVGNDTLGSGGAGNSTTINGSSVVDSVGNSEDQQANNATLGSAAQKGSEPRINTSSSEARNNETGRSGGGGAGNSGGNNGEDSTAASATTSYYSRHEDESSTANFNRASSSFDADNKAGGSRSKETSAPDNEDESTESWLTLVDSFSTASPDDRLASSSTEDDANEAVHARSEESYLISRLASKERAANGIKDSLEDLLARMELEEEAAAVTSEGPLAPSSASGEPLTQSLEDFFNNESSGSFEFNTTKSLEALLESMDKQRRSEEIATGSPDNKSGFEATTIDLEEASTTSDSFEEADDLLQLIDDLVSVEGTNESMEATTTTTTTRLVQLISGKLSTTVSHSFNETTTEYSDTTGYTEPAENRTIDLGDDLAKETMAADDWGSTSDAPATTIEYPTTTARQDEPHHQSRKVLMIIQHGEEDRGSGKLLRLPSPSPDAWESREEPEVEEEEKATVASPRNQLDRQLPGVGMNKRKSRKRAGAQLLDAERQYRTLPAEEQTRFAEKRPDHGNSTAVAGRWSSSQ